MGFYRARACSAGAFLPSPYCWVPGCCWRDRLFSSSRSLRQSEVRLAQSAELWASEAQPHPVLAAPVILASLPFSPLDFQTDGVRLVRWLPGANGGELTLKVDWAQIPAVFERLAQRGMAVSGFSVKPEEARLQLVLQVENTDAN